MGEYEERYSKDYRRGYALMVALAMIEGAVFMLAGVQLVRVTQWMPLIAGALLLIFGSASLFASVQMIVRKNWGDAMLRAEMENRKVNEMFNDMDEADEEE